MPQFEEYRNMNTRQEKEAFYQAEKNKGIDINMSKFDYDSDNIIEHVNRKFDDGADPEEAAVAFARRTAYYFTDAEVANAKVVRYSSLKPRGEKARDMEAYAKKYTYHDADKRKSRAEDAANAFNDMWRKIREYGEDANSDQYTKYKHREEIMKYRLEGMINAVKAKAQDAEHEKYLIARAKLSCNLILRDQLSHLMAENGVNPAMLRKFNSKLAVVNSKIKDAADDLTKSVPKAQDLWRRGNRLDKSSYNDLLKGYKLQNPGCDLTSAVIMGNLNKYQVQQFGNKWPKKTVLKDQNNANVSKTEKENEDWNTQNIKPGVPVTPEIEKEAADRFESIPVPKAEELKGSGARNYVMNHLREYYDLTKRALPYYKAQMGQNTPAGRIIADRPKMRAKIEFIDALDKYINYKLRRDHCIEFNNETGSFQFESDETYKYIKDENGKITRTRQFGTDENGKSQTNADYNRLLEAYNRFSETLVAEGVGRILPKEEENKQPQKAQQQGQAAQLHPAQQQGQAAQLHPAQQQGQAVQPKQEQDQQGQIKQEQIARPVQENVGKHEKDGLKQVAGMVNLLNPKQEQKEEKNAEVKKAEAKKKVKTTRKKKNGLIYVTEGEKQYVYTKDQEKEYNMIKKAIPEFDRDSFKAMLACRNGKTQWNTAEYTALYNNCVKDIKTSKTIERDMVAPMRTVNRDAKGDPLTDNDTKNDEWNKEWLRSWQADKNGVSDQKKSQAMLRKELPNLYDDFIEGEFKLPDELLNYKDGDGIEAAKKALDNYVENLIYSDNLFKFQTIVAKHLAVENLKKNIKSVNIYFQRNSQMAVAGDIIGDINILIGQKFMKKFGLNNYNVADKGAIKLAPGKKKSADEIYDAYLDVLLGKLKANNTHLKEKETSHYLSDIELRDSRHIFDKQFTDKEKASGATDAGLKFAFEKRKVFCINNVPEYIQYLKKIPKKLAEGANKTSVDRIVGFAMHKVEFDEMLRPVQTPENLEKHNWNLKWLKAWEEKDGKVDEKTINEMISHETEHILDGLELPPLPKSEKKDAEYIKKLNAWADNMFVSSADKFHTVMLKTLSMDALKKAYEPFRKYVTENKYFSKLTSMFTTLYQYLIFYSQVNHNADSDKKADTFVPDKNAVNAAHMQLPAFEEIITQELFELSKLENNGLSYKESVEGKKVEKKEENQEVNKKEENKEEIKQEEKKEENQEVNKKEENQEEIKQEEKKQENKEDKHEEKQDNLIVVEDEEEEEVEQEKVKKAAVTVNALGWVKGNYSARKDAENEQDKKSKAKMEIRLPDLETLTRQVELRKLKKGEKRDNRKKQKVDVGIRNMMSETLTSISNMIADQRVLARRNVGINSKKKLDFRTFELLSGIGPVFKQKGALSKLCRDYGAGRALRLSGNKEEGDRKVYEVLDNITLEIEKFDPAKYDFSNDEGMISKAGELEKMSEAARSYRQLIMREENRGYLEKLSKENGKIYRNATRAAEVYAKIEQLTAVSNYYRLRKLVLTDELYTSDEKGQIGYSNAQGDTSQVKRLKKMMRASLLAGSNMNKVFTRGPRVIKQDKIVESFEALEKSDEYVMDMEREKFFQAPLWAQNCLTLDPKKIPSKIDKSRGYSGINHPQADGPFLLKKAMEMNPRIQDMDDKRMEVLTELTGNPKESWDDTPKFVGGNDKSLESVKLSDNWSRIRLVFGQEFSRYMSDQEILEMTEILQIQKAKEWTDKEGNKHSFNWADMAGDKDALAYYESAFKELAMKFLFAQYAAAMRVAETISMKLVVLHPTDLALLMTPEVHYMIMSCSTLSNIIDKRNGTNTKKVAKFLKDNDPDGRYKLNIKDMITVSGLTSKLNLKVGNIGYALNNLLKLDLFRSDKLNRTAEKAVFGKNNIYNNSVLKEYEANRKINPEEERDETAWYLDKHIDMVTKKGLNAKSKTLGGGYLQYELSNWHFEAYKNGEIDFKNAIDNKLVDVPSKKELDAYEAHLVKDGYYPLRSNMADPDSGMKYDNKPTDKYDIVDEYGRTVGKGTYKERLDNRAKDPYGINLIRTGFKELEYTYDAVNKNKEKIKKTCIRTNAF